MRLLVIRVDASDPPARLGEWLIDAGLELDVRNLDAGDELPADLSGHAGVVVMGGAMGAYDDEEFPYLADVKSLLRDAVAHEVPTLGVCLGHQLLAVANGGQVRRNPAGIEVGALLVAKRSAAAGDPLFRSLPITPDVMQWHVDEVSVLPPGAVQLASSPGCEHQAFRLGRLAWGIQFHIETTPQLFLDWVRNDASDLDGFDVDALVERAIAAHDDFAEVWPQFAAAFADVVRDPDSVLPANGVPTSTADPLTDPAAIRAALAAEANAARAPLPMPALRRASD